MKPLRPDFRKALAAVGGGLIIAAVGISAATATQRHDNALQLSWDGVNYRSSTSEAFFGTPVVVPGDSARRTLLVRNDGPSDAILRARISDVNLTHDRPEGFYDKLLIDWNTGQTTMRQLAANGETTIIDVQLAQGEETELTIGYHLPQDTVVGNRRSGEKRLAGFNVELELVGMTPVTDE